MAVVSAEKRSDCPAHKTKKQKTKKTKWRRFSSLGWAGVRERCGQVERESVCVCVCLSSQCLVFAGVTKWSVDVFLFLFLFFGSLLVPHSVDQRTQAKECREMLLCLSRSLLLTWMGGRGCNYCIPTFVFCVFFFFKLQLFSCSTS